MSSSVEAICVPPDRAHVVWPLIRERVKRALERGDMGGDIEELEADVLSGDALIWIAWDGFEIIGCAVTILQGEGSAKHCNILACAGSCIARWVGLIEKIEAFAKSEGCGSVRLSGRTGWLRMLDGYRTKRVVLSKELS